jgi:hypothetical protein
LKERIRRSHASTWLVASLVVAATSFLQACGGGGDAASVGSNTTPTPNAQGSVTNDGPSCAALVPAQPVTVTPVANAVTVSGTATFESVPNNPSNGALDYAATSSKPARGVTVQAMSGATVLASATTNAQGQYALALPANTSYFLRLRAEMVQTTTWNVTVKDNSAGDALWVVDSPVASSGAASSVRSINAGSGWNGTAYSAARGAGPFAILDTVYSGVQLVNSVRPASRFPPLTLFWSPNNNVVRGSLALGEVGTSFFSTKVECGDASRFIYILGKQDQDTDEYDSAVVAHEFGHYLQSAFSTNTSLGGSHGPDDKLDMNLAFSEGWGNAWSSMVRNDPLYLDSSGRSQGPGASLSLDIAPADAARGWYREDSVGTILYQLFKGQGFAPVWTALEGPMRTQDALASIFSFASAVRSAGSTAVTSAMNALIAAQNIFAGATADQWGTGEANNGGNSGNLPMYNRLTLNSPLQTCFIKTNLGDSSLNKLGSVKYYRLTLPSAGVRTFSASFSVGRDIDFQVFQKSVLLADASSTEPTSETASVNLAAGEVVVRVSDFNVFSIPENTTACGTLTVN